MTGLFSEFSKVNSRVLLCPWGQWGVLYDKFGGACSDECTFIRGGLLEVVPEGLGSAGVVGGVRGRGGGGCQYLQAHL
jgi:hypothetical protein